MSAHEEVLSSRDYARLCDLIYAEAGIHLGSGKKTMLEVRIKRRLKALDLGSYGQYCDFLFARQGLKQEIANFIDVVTTNKTDFFREPRHFDFLVGKVLPEFTSRDGGGKPMLVWSAGCSTGEEPYTLAMVLSEYAAAHQGFRFRILATDISTTVLAKAETGVYTGEIVNPVPAALRRKYIMGSRDRGSNQVRIVPELRRLIEFRRLNFMDADFGLSELPEIVFCRNVIIYFDRDTQVRLVQKLTRQLAPGGYFFAGHSESLQGMDLPLFPVGPAVYRKPQ